MTRLLFTVENLFHIEGRGVVLVPGIKLRREDRFLRGDPIELRRPDGTILVTQFVGVEMFMDAPSYRDTMPLLLQIKKTDAPVGTEVWAV